MEEAFFLQYHLRMGYRESLSLEVRERRWFIQRLIKQKQKENEAIEAAKRTAKSRRPG